MSLPKNGAAVHFILSDLILGLLRNPNSVGINRSVDKSISGFVLAIFSGPGRDRALARISKLVIFT